jgi:hypothetical protein
MERRVVTALAVLIVAMARPAVSQTLTVRVFNNVGVPAEELRVARDRAGEILKDAGISVVWEDCWYLNKETAGASARCLETVGPNEMVLRLQRANAQPGERYTSLGFSLVVTEGVPFLATVYADLVTSVARGAGVSSRVVLGRAIAHEIGHVLLNTNSHPQTGLMRAAWSRKELRRNEAGDWRFLDREAARMRDAATARAGVHQESTNSRVSPSGEQAVNR